MSRPGQFDPDGESASSRRWLWAGLMLALLVRMIPSVFPSLWYDEYYTLSIGRFSSARILDITFHKDVHPPVYYLLIHYLMQLGDLLGGIFATQFFLRMASVVCGLAVCWMMHRAVRKHWGEGAARAVLVLGALSPALVHYSIELRDYALVTALVLGATLALLEILHRGGWQPRLAGLYVVLMTLALYTHSLAFLYLFGQGLVVVAELVRRSGSARTLLIQAMGAAMLVLLLHAPWLGSFFQDEKLTFRGFDFLEFAGPADLLPAYFFYPFYGLTVDLFSWAHPWMLVGIAVVLIVLVIAIIAVVHGRRTVVEPDGLDVQPDRLLMTAAIMAIAPVGLAFVLSWAELAKLFMVNRYNYIALPFMLLAWVGLARRARGLKMRWALMLFPLLPAAIGLPYNYHARFTGAPEITCFPQLTALKPQPSTTYLIDEAIFPWLQGPGHFEPIGPMLEGHDENAEPLLVAQHFISRHMLVRREADLTGISIERTPGVTQLDLQHEQTYGPCWVYSRAWLLPPGELGAVRATRAELEQAFEARRTTSPGGQKLLPDDPAFYAAKGFGILEIEESLNPYRWTVGLNQHVSWTGPESPGKYMLRVHFWRPDPLPQPRIEVFARVTGGDPNGYRIAVGQTGHVLLPLPLEVTQPGQRLTLEMEIPTWSPGGSGSDARQLGMMFLDMELIPR